MTLATKKANAIYSYYVEDLETILYLLEGQDTKLSPKNTQYTPTLHLSLGNVSQFASDQPIRSGAYE